ncbi:MAG TPA: cyclic-di-AMP receptor [Anaerolineales bacterium]
MKLIVAILRDEDSEPVSQALISEGFRVTRIASTGGFLRRGSTTMMIGVEAGKVDEAIEIVRENCALSVEPGLKRATLFVLDVDRFTQL